MSILSSNISLRYVDLRPYDESFRGDPERETIFLVETSTRNTIHDRAACALESAARKLGLSVVYLMATPRLKVVDKITGQLYGKYSGRGIQFLRINLTAILAGDLGGVERLLSKY